MKFNCSVCGIEFIAKPGRKRKFCSRKCSNIGKIKWCKGLKGEEYLKHFKNGKTWNKGNIIKFEKICVYCKKIFFHIDKRQKYCSRECYEIERKPKERNCLECRNKIIFKNKNYRVNFCSQSCCRKFAWKNNIYNEEVIRKLSEKAKNRTRELSSNWHGGISFEPYGLDFNKLFKNLIRQRDNQICMLCLIHREKLNQALCIHHIDYNKLNSNKENCISLCNSCHVKTNGNREHWIKFFQSLLSERYGYVYNYV